MNGKILSQAKNMMRRTPDLIKFGQDGFERLREDMREKEYLVFVKPVAHRLKQALGKNDDSSGEALEVEAESSVMDPITQEEADSLLVDEVFIRLGSVISQPDEPEKGVQTTNPVSTSEATDIHVETPLEVLAEIPTVSPQEVPAAAVPEARGAVTRPPKAPLVRTMVEAIPELASESGGLSDILIDDLHDIFTTTSYINARTKALLKSRESIDIHELAKELQEYSQSIGASPSETLS